MAEKIGLRRERSSYHIVTVALAEIWFYLLGRASMLVLCVLLVAALLDIWDQWRKEAFNPAVLVSLAIAVTVLTLIVVVVIEVVIVGGALSGAISTWDELGFEQWGSGGP
jgi:ABC-type multidrug transport system permease subunit